jgi:hypothetical protein
VKNPGQPCRGGPVPLSRRPGRAERPVGAFSQAHRVPLGDLRGSRQEMAAGQWLAFVCRAAVACGAVCCGAVSYGAACCVAVSYGAVCCGTVCCGTVSWGTGAWAAGAWAARPALDQADKAHQAEQHGRGDHRVGQDNRRWRVPESGRKRARGLACVSRQPRPRLNVHQRPPRYSRTSQLNIATDNHDAKRDFCTDS